MYLSAAEGEVIDSMKTGLVLEGGYQKKPEAVLLTKLKYRKYPKFAKTLLNRAEDYNLCMDEILEMEKQGEVFLIQPSVPLEVGRTETDPDKIQSAYDQGVADARALLGALKEGCIHKIQKSPEIRQKITKI